MTWLSLQPSTWASLHRAAECLQDMAVDFSLIEVKGDGAQNRRHRAFHNLISKATGHHFHCILWVTHRSPVVVRKETTRSVNTGRSGPMGAVLEGDHCTGYSSGKVSFKSPSCWLRGIAAYCFCSSWEIYTPMGLCMWVCP